MKAHRVVRRCHIFRHSAHRWRRGCQHYAPAVFLPPGRFLVLISVRGWIDPTAIVRLEGLGKLKKKNALYPGLEPATFRLVALCLTTRTLSCGRGTKYTIRSIN
jgi:hypothetical protein